MRQLFEAVENLNLSSVKDRFLRTRPGEDAEQLQRQYREFLVAMGVAKGPIAVPEVLDEFWHAHILDTRKYWRDCQKLFGAFLHHDSLAHAATPSEVASTAALLEHLFGAGDHWGLTDPDVKLALCLPTIDKELTAH